MLDLWGSFSTDLGVDLGTDHTRICLRDEGIVLDEPTARQWTCARGRFWPWAGKPGRCWAGPRKGSRWSGLSRTGSLPTLI